MLVRRLSGARTVIRTGDTAYLDTWRGGDLDVDFIVCRSNIELRGLSWGYAAW
jgi:hypothetical protein